jgi:hypothetical protein
MFLNGYISDGEPGYPTSTFPMVAGVYQEKVLVGIETAVGFYSRSGMFFLDFLKVSVPNSAATFRTIGIDDQSVSDF